MDHQKKSPPALLETERAEPETRGEAISEPEDMVTSLDSNGDTKHSAETNSGAEAVRLPDPFDPERLARKGNPAGGISVKRVLAHVPVRKPNKQEYIRAHPDPRYQVLPVSILELAVEREIYCVVPEVAEALPGEIRDVLLKTCVNRQGTVFLWPVPLPSADGKELAWHITAREAATRAESVWVRLVPNMNAGCYDIYEAAAVTAKPVWPDLPMRDLLALAFSNGRLIDSLEHPLIKQLRGLA
jgi:hypothetical protein